MKSRIIALAVALAVAFAGCIEIDPVLPFKNVDDDAFNPPTRSQEDDQGDPEPTPPAPTPSAPPDEEDDEPGNRAPVAELSVDNTSGDAPLNVTITLNGSDADGDDLTWTLDLGAGGDPLTGDALPHTLNHNYADAGNYTITFTVSDGELDDSAQKIISVTLPPGAIPTQNPLGGTFYLGLPAELDLCIAGVNAHDRALQSAGPGWIFKMTENADLFKLLWFNDFEAAWILDDLLGDETGYLETTDATFGVVPEDATHVLVCVRDVLADPDNLPPVSFSLGLWHPLDPDAPSG